MSTGGGYKDGLCELSGPGRGVHRVQRLTVSVFAPRSNAGSAALSGGQDFAGPGKEFVNVDLSSVRASAAAAIRANIAHFIYVSVAQPAPVMQAHIDVRAAGEKTLADSGLKVTILRPWYVGAGP